MIQAASSSWKQSEIRSDMDSFRRSHYDSQLQSGSGDSFLISYLWRCETSRRSTTWWRTLVAAAAATTHANYWSYPSWWWGSFGRVWVWELVGCRDGRGRKGTWVQERRLLKKRPIFFNPPQVWLRLRIWWWWKWQRRREREYLFASQFWYLNLLSEKRKIFHKANVFFILNLLRTRCGVFVVC